MQARQKEIHTDKVEEQKLSVLVMAKNEEIYALKQSSHELGEKMSILHQQVRGQIHFTYITVYRTRSYILLMLIHSILLRVCTVYTLHTLVPKYFLCDVYPLME